MIQDRRPNSRRRNPPTPVPGPRYHRLCTVCHIRIVPKGTIRTCFACSEPDPDLDELTRMIRKGITTPRAYLEPRLDSPARRSVEPESAANRERG